MIIAELRERMIARLDDLTETELESLLRYVDVIQASEQPEDYDEGDDPLVGFISGPTDLARRTEAILQAEFDVKNEGE